MKTFMAVATVGPSVWEILKRNSSYAVLPDWGTVSELRSGEKADGISASLDIRPDYANAERNGSLEKVDPDEVRSAVSCTECGREKRFPLTELSQGKTTLNKRLYRRKPAQRCKEGDEIISGCINMTGVLKIRTTREFGESTVSKILIWWRIPVQGKSRSEKILYPNLPAIIRL